MLTSSVHATYQAVDTIHDLAEAALDATEGDREQLGRSAVRLGIGRGRTSRDRVLVSGYNAH